MFLRIIINLILFFMLFGCGFMFDGKKRDDSRDDFKVSDEIKRFAIEVTKSSDVNSVLKNGMNISEKLDNKYQKESIESCQGGGSINLITDDDNDSILEVIADECIDDGIKISYSASVKIEKKDNNLEKTTILLNKNATFEDLETDIITTFFKDSIVIIDELSSNKYTITETIKSTISTGKKYESINLISYEQDMENISSIYEVSGQRVYNGITYSVDEEYDSSKTPIIIIYEGSNEYVVSGVAKYYNQEHQHITIDIVARDKMKISVDINNDGVDDVKETISI